MINATPLRCIGRRRAAVKVDAVQGEVVFTTGVGDTIVDAVQGEVVFTTGTGSTQVDSVVAEVVFS